MLFLAKIIVSYIIQVYTSLCRSLSTIYQYRFLNFAVACFVTIHNLRVVLWFIFNHGSVNGILQSLNIVFSTASIIVINVIFIQYQWYDIYLLCNPKPNYHAWL